MAGKKCGVEGVANKMTDAVKGVVRDGGMEVFAYASGDYDDKHDQYAISSNMGDEGLGIMVYQLCKLSPTHLFVIAEQVKRAAQELEKTAKAAIQERTKMENAVPGSSNVH